MAEAVPEAAADAVPDFDDVADELYGLPRDDFVPRRDELAKAARAAKDKETATAIGRLRKPSQAAWLANLLARDHPDEIGALDDLGASLRSAQEHLAGDALRTLSRQRHDLVNALVARGRRVARAEGVRIGESVARELERTVMAALADPRAARALAAGRLVTSLEPGVGLGDDGAATVPPPDRPRTPRRPPPRPRPEDGAGEGGDDEVRADDDVAPGPTGADDERARREREERERAERERRDRERAEREQAVEAAREAVDAADTAVTTAREKADAADGARAEAADVVRDLRDRLAAAEQDERAAASRAAEARDARDDRERAARYAADELDRAQRRLAEVTDGAGGAGGRAENAGSRQRLGSARGELDAATTSPV